MRVWVTRSVSGAGAGTGWVIDRAHSKRLAPRQSAADGACAAGPSQVVQGDRERPAIVAGGLIRVDVERRADREIIVAERRADAKADGAGRQDRGRRAADLEIADAHPLPGPGDPDVVR